jgi:protoporphyrinogen oxidase
MEEISIVGAGIAGLTAGYLLSQKGYNVTVIEKEDRVGGLARSFYYDEFVFDIGPHRFHTDDREVLAFIEDILGEKKLVIPRSSGVWMFGKYHDWPLNWKVLFKLPPSVILRTMWDLFSKKAYPGDSFEEYILSRYGKTLYDVFFKPYTEKFLKLSPHKVHNNWAESGIDRAVIDPKVQMGSLFEVVRTAMLPTPVKTNFLYPSAGGIDMFCRKLAGTIEKNGGKILLNTVIDSFECEGSKIKSVFCQGKRSHPTTIIWTAPLTTLISLLRLPPADIKYLALVLYNIEVRGKCKTKFQWCYYGQNDTTINRISVPALFANHASPAGHTGICAEVTCMEGDEVWQNPEQLIDTVINDLISVRLVGNTKDIENVHIEKILNTYPVYEIDYPGKLEKVMKAVAPYRQLKLLGRTGTFWYNNMDHSIRMAMDLVKDLLCTNSHTHR